MQSLEISGMDEIQKIFNQLPEAIRQIKADMFESVGEYLLENIQDRIGGSGRVAGVQEYQVGSGKGYVAVRAMKDTELDGYAAGYITNALENGHEQAKGRYVPNLGVSLRRERVPGKYMYDMQGKYEVPRITEEAAKRVEKAVVKILKGDTPSWSVPRPQMGGEGSRWTFIRKEG